MTTDLQVVHHVRLVCVRACERDVLRRTVFYLKNLSLHLIKSSAHVVWLGFAKKFIVLKRRYDQDGG